MTDGPGHNGLVRLSKVMADRGLCSRREADGFIAAGLVLVEGVRIDQLGTRIRPDARVELDPKARQQQRELVTILLNKPIGWVSTQPEAGYRAAIELITAENQDPQFPGMTLRREHLQGLGPAGRLDIESKGLLVFTQDGRIARMLIGEDSDTEKEYLVRVEGELPLEQFQKLRHGLWLDGKALRPAMVEWVNHDQLKFTLREGKKRQIRRMCEAVGLRVTGLKRVRIGAVRLGQLAEGKWRFLRPGERFDAPYDPRQ
jgi:23S rRNA pseudouridine2604 synthase